MSSTGWKAALLGLFVILLSRQTFAQGVDLQRYCKTQGFSDVVNLDGTGYGWRCSPGNISISIDDVCREQYGDTYKASLRSSPPGLATDWRFIESTVGPTGPALLAAEGMPMDLQRYCQTVGYSGVTNIDNTGYGWRCMPGRVSIVAGDVCRSQYGENFQAILKTKPPGRAEDWICRDTSTMFPAWASSPRVKIALPSSDGSGADIRMANPPMPNELALRKCKNESSNQGEFYACVTERAYPKQYQISVGCREQNPTDGGRAYACTTGNQRVVELYDRVKEAKACYDRSSKDNFQITQCIGDQVPGSNERYYLSCVTGNRGDYTASAVCAMSKDFTPEQQTAISCAIETGGNPKAFALCTGGKLMTRELDKCMSGGIATENGCFGPNNEFRKYLTAADVPVRNALGESSEAYKAYQFWKNNVLAPTENHEVVKAFNTGLRDLQNGPSQSNDIVKGVEAVGGAVQSVGTAIVEVFDF